MRTRILVADDHQVVREGLNAIFESEDDYEIVGQARDGFEAVRLAESLQPDVLLLDLRMPGLDGVTVVRRLKDKCPSTKFVVLTSFDTEPDVLAALEAGVEGFLLKEAMSDELLRAVDAVMAGRSYLDPSVAHRVVGRVAGGAVADGDGRQKGKHGLSPRERQVLELMVSGMRNREIAQALWVSERTVKAITGNIMRKLGQSSRVQACVYALQNRIVEPPLPGDA